MAKADRPRSGSFSSLLRQVSADRSALDALVFAYEGLAPAERLSLVRAVMQDTRSPAMALAAFLTVEEDPALRKRLEALIRRHAIVDRSAWAAGSEQSGRAALAQALDGRCADVLRISWNQREIKELKIQSHLDPRLLSQTELKPSDPHALVDVLAPMLWRHLRRGSSIPSGLDRFAGFFSLGGSPESAMARRWGQW
jgi:hypothetical protein